MRKVPKDYVMNFNALDRTPLSKGTNKKNEQYNRAVNYPPGMQDLVRVVAGMQKDIKTLRNVQTLDDAKVYAGKRKNWTAHEADITGANGKPDGVPEVFVCDAKGNIKVINGYALARSKYAERNAYRSVVDEDLRRGYRDAETNQYQPGYNLKAFIGDNNRYGEEGGQFIRGLGQPELPQQFQFLRSQKVDPRKIFRDLFFADAWEEIKDAYKEEGLPRDLLLRIYAKAFPMAYRGLVIDPIAEESNVNLTNVTPAKLSKLVNSDTFKDLAVNRL
jgi:hypothetical protein